MSGGLEVVCANVKESPTEVYIALGSNLGDRTGYIASALEALAALATDGQVACSPLYETAPMGPQDQPAYVNAVCRLSTRLLPLALLDATQAVEIAQGRVRDVNKPAIRWGPRSLDLDILLYGEQRFENERLTVPHPGMAQRSFVLQPLVDLEAALEIPGLGPASELLRQCEKFDIRPLTDMS